MLHERDLLPVLLTTLVASPLLAWLAGWLVARQLRATPGTARRWMPTLPELPPGDGTPAARFDRQVRLAEAKAVSLLRRQPGPMLTGLHRDHLAGASRLAGGPLATVAVLAAVAAGVTEDVPVKGLELSFAALFCVLTPGTLMLAAVARQAVAESALQGLLRDVRRHTVAAVRAALGAGQQSLDAHALANQLTRAVAPLRPPWPPGSVLREVQAALADLGMEPDLQGGGGKWGLEPLRRRQLALKALRAAEPGARRIAGADDIVFDSGVP